MIVRYGRTCEEGMLPVFSVGSEKEAKALLVLSCPTNRDGEYIARQLAHDQSLENLQEFSDFLAERHEILVENGRCDCKGTLKKQDYKCYHCEKEVDKDYFCHGCKEYICDSCEDLESVASRMMGSHDPMDHVTNFLEEYS